MGEAADGTQEIAAHSSGVGRAVEETSHTAHNTQQVTQTLARMAAELHQLVGQVRYECGPEDAGRPAAPPTGNGRN